MSIEKLRELEQKWRKEELPSAKAAKRECADELSAILRQMEEPWQPMSSAPKDTGSNAYYLFYDSALGWQVVLSWPGGLLMKGVAYWMPLPQPPKGVGSET